MAIQIKGALDDGNGLIIVQVQSDGTVRVPIDPSDRSIPDPPPESSDTITGNLTVGGSVTVGTTLATTGAATLASASITGAATVGTTLGVTGAATLASVGVTGAATVGTTLGVTGASTVAAVTASGLVTMNAGAVLGDAQNIAVNTVTGTKIGTATGQKIALWNATPVVQPSTTGEVTGFTAGAGAALLVDSTFTGATGTKAYTVSDIVKALKAAGIMASS